MSMDNKNRTSGDGEEDKSIKILIAEDDPIIRMVLEQLSKRKGWEVFLEEDGEGTLDTYQKQKVDLIIMDCQIPVLDGYKTAETIRKLESRNGRHVPIIAMTANALTGVREKCLKAGMDDYLAKPVEVDEFYAAVEKWAKGSANS